MTEFCFIGIVGLGILAIGLHLSALIKPPRRVYRRLPIRYLPPASRPLNLPDKTRHSTLIQGNKR